LRDLGVIANTAEDRAKTTKRAHHGEQVFGYVVNSCEYDTYRQLTALGQRRTVIAPSMISRKPGKRIKTKRRDFSEAVRVKRQLTMVFPAYIESLKKL
jgi:transposase